MSTTVIAGFAGDLEVAVHDHVGARAIAVICHPHPLAGGTMTNKVVTSTERACQELGMATLRFNFRGVGKSSGTHDHGIGEQDDAATAVAHLRALYPGLPLLLAGFSFGAFVAAHVAIRVQPTHLITIAPPIGRWDFSGFQHPLCRWSVLQPDADEVVSPAAVYAWVETLDPKPNLHRFPETSHFFHSKLTDLRTALHAEIEAAGWLA